MGKLNGDVAFSSPAFTLSPNAKTKGFNETEIADKLPIIFRERIA